MEKSMPYKNERRQDLVSFPVIVGVLLTVLSQFFIETDYYPSVRKLIYGVIVIGALINVFRLKIRKDSFQLGYLSLMMLGLLNALIVLLFTSNMIAIKYAVEMSFPFLIMLLGYNLRMTSKAKYKLIFAYVLMATLLGLFMIMAYGDGFNITQMYFLRSKNQIGPFIASSSLISLIAFLTVKDKPEINHKRITLLVFFSINMAVLLAIRNRSGIVAVALCFFVFLFSKIRINKSNKIKAYQMFLFLITLVTIPLLIAFGVLDPLIDYVMKSMFLNYNLTDLNSLSANRTGVYSEVIDFLSRSPFFGELTIQSGIIETPHNYLLNQWFNFGLAGMIPLTSFYIFVWGYVLNRIFKHKEVSESIYLMLFMLFISLFEYSYPYSPLTTVCLTWFMFGVDQKNRN